MKIKFLTIQALFFATSISAMFIPGAFAKKPECRYPQVCRFADACIEKYQADFGNQVGVSELTLQNESCLPTTASFVSDLSGNIVYRDQEGNFLSPRKVLDPKTGLEKMSLGLNRDPYYMYHVHILQSMDATLKNPSATLEDMNKEFRAKSMMKKFIIAKKAQMQARKAV